MDEPGSAGFDAGDCNLYRYLSNQAVHAIDPSGLDIYYLWSPMSSGLPGIKNVGPGHASVLVGPIDGYWYHFNFDAKNIRPSSGNIQVVKFNSLKEALNSEKLKRYTDFLHFYTRPEQDKKIYEYATQLANKPPRFILTPTSVHGVFEINAKNCTLVAGMIIQSGGIQFDNKNWFIGGQIVPKTAYNDNIGNSQHFGKVDALKGGVNNPKGEFDSRGRPSIIRFPGR